MSAGLQLYAVGSQRKKGSIDAPVNDSRTVGGIALELLRRLDPRRPVRLLGVRVAGLDESGAQPFSDDQLSLSL